MKVYVVTQQNQDENSDLLSVHRSEEGAKDFIDLHVASEKPYEGAIWKRIEPGAARANYYPESWRHIYGTTYPWTYVYYEEAELSGSLI